MTRTLALGAPSRASLAVPLIAAITACFFVFYCQAMMICGCAVDPLTAIRDAVGGRAPTAATPVSIVPRNAPAPPFHLHAATPAEYQRAVRCLTDAIYYEAGDEPVEGQRAVAQVVLNRVRDPNFPKSVCGVVYQGWRRKTGCQFSFACDGSIRRRHAVPALWNRMRPLAEQALNGYVVTEVGAATHYYATYVRPNWLVSVNPVTQVGQQVFCAWKGEAGQARALSASYQGGEFDVSDLALEGGLPPARTQRGHHAAQSALGRPHLRIAAASRGDARA
ncbi:MAG TPA: cell wall hydrolase [Caulobacteraceae bacterium]|jgi:hypothetical protein|nr:cell wall hydrolase [Caulobacteraceae bacterium]